MNLKIPNLNLILHDIGITIHFRFASIELAPASITDDTEMALTLLESLLDNDLEYNHDDVLLNYMRWASRPYKPIGKNTSKLLKGIKTIRGYERRFAKFKDEMPNIQSNGSLMRTLPLVLLSDWKQVSKIDVALTNDNEINIECSQIYLQLLRNIIFGDECQHQIENPIIKKYMKYASHDKIRDEVMTKETKGWVIIALYVAIITVRNSHSFESGMDFIAEHFINGDTDTIMAIAGGLLGAIYGFEKMKQDEKTGINIKKINKYFESTDSKYVINDELLERIRKLDIFKNDVFQGKNNSIFIS